MPVFRDLWRPQPRRTLADQSTAAVDADPTVHMPWSYTRPYQLGRGRDASYAAIGQVRAWQNSQRTGNDLGTTDYDPTLVRPNIAPYPYQQKFRWLEGSYAAVRAFRLNQLTSNDLGSADADPTVRQPWAESNPYQLRWRDPTVGVVAANRAWTLDRLTSNDLGVADYDPTVKPNWQAANPYQLRYRDPTVGAVEATRAWFLGRLTSNDLGTADYDPTVRPLFQAANPYQLHQAPNDLPAIEAAMLQYHMWQASTPVDTVVDADPTLTRRPWQPPYRLFSLLNVPAVEATFARLHLLQPPVEDSTDPTYAHKPWVAANPYQLRWRDPTVGLIEAMRAWAFRRRTTIGTIEGEGTVTLVLVGRGDATAGFTTRGVAQVTPSSSSGRGGVRVARTEGSVSLTNTGRGVAQVEGTDT